MTIGLIIFLVTLQLIRLYLITYFFKFADIDKANHEVYLRAAVQNNNVIKNFVFDLELDYPTLAHRIAHKIGFLNTQIFCEIILSFVIFMYLDATSSVGLLLYVLYLLSFPIFADLLQFNARTLGLIIILIHLPFVTEDSVLLYVGSSVSLLVANIHISRFSFQASLMFLITYFCIFDIKSLILILAISSIALLNRRTRLLFGGWYGHILWSFKNQYELYIKKGYFRLYGEKVEKFNKKFILRRILGRLRAIANNNITLCFIMVSASSMGPSLIFLAVFILLSISPRLDRTIGEADRYIAYAFIFGLVGYSYDVSIEQNFLGFELVLLPFLLLSATGLFLFNLKSLAQALRERHTARSRLKSQIDRHMRQIPTDMKICTLPISLGNLISENRTTYPYTPRGAEFLSSCGLYPYFSPKPNAEKFYDYFIISKSIKAEWINRVMTDLQLKVLDEDESFLICRS